jgi:hypothetical protein
VRIDGRDYDALKGRLELGEHSTFSTDRDYFRIDVPAGTLVEVNVDPAGPESCIDPHVSTIAIGLNPKAQGLLTVNDNRSSTERAARTLVAAPFDMPQRWFVVVEDARGLDDAILPDGDLSYVLNLQAVGRVEYELLEFSGTVAQTRRAELRFAGDIHYYQFVDPEHRQHTVRFRTDNPEFCGHVWQIDPDDGARWLNSGATAEPPCTNRLEWSTDATYFDPETHAYGIVVTDANGRGSNLDLGDFTYDLDVSREN